MGRLAGGGIPGASVGSDPLDDFAGSWKALQVRERGARAMSAAPALHAARLPSAAATMALAERSPAARTWLCICPNATAASASGSAPT
jgi:hypothetical protein